MSSLAELTASFPRSILYHSYHHHVHMSLRTHSCVAHCLYRQYLSFLKTECERRKMRGRRNKAVGQSRSKCGMDGEVEHKEGKEIRQEKRFVRSRGIRKRGWRRRNRRNRVHKNKRMKEEKKEGNDNVRKSKETRLN